MSEQPEATNAEDFWNSCPDCKSLDTRITDTRHPYTGVEVDRICNACGKVWNTKVYSNDYLDEFDTGRDEFGDDTEAELCEYCSGTGFLEELLGDCPYCDGEGYKWWL